MKTQTGFIERFPRAGRYARLQMPQRHVVRETVPDDSAFPYSERHLQCVWYDPAWRPEILYSSDGEKVTVENPGRWNLEPGPDFLDASFSIGPEHRKIRGDVEIHVRPADWRQHDHQRDPAYARVVAHVTYFPGELAADMLPAGAIQISLKDPLKSNPAFCLESIDLTAYPYANRPAKTPPCFEALASWPPTRKAAFLESAGEQRLKTKTDRLILEIEERGPDQALYEAILCALGYKHNRLPFRQLACRLPISVLTAETDGDSIKAYSLLLGVAGLMPAKVSPLWDNATRAFVRDIWDYWWKQRSKWEQRVMPKKSWRIAALRPSNHPVRRLAAAAALFAGAKDLRVRILSLDASNAKSWFKAAAKLIGSPSIAYWRRRLSFSGKQQPSDCALIGARRTAAIMSNVLIPFLAAHNIPVSALLNDLPAEEDNSLIRETAFALFGRDQNPALYRTGLRQQGLLQIFHDFCINNRAACAQCRLPPALQAPEIP